MPVISKQKGPRLLGAALFLWIFGVACAYPGEFPLRRVSFEGDPLFSQSDALEVSGLHPGNPLTREVMQAAADRVRRAAAEHYYPMARVRWRMEPVSVGQARNAVFALALGPRGRLKEVRINGNRELSDRILRAGLVARPRRAPWHRWLRRDVFNLEDLEQDRATLLGLYLQRGYAAAEVAPPLVERPTGLDGFRITWTVVREGPVFSIGYVGLDTDIHLPREILSQNLDFRSGERFDAERIRRARDGLEEYLLLHGHAFARVHMESDRVDDQRRVDLVMVVVAGPRTRLRKLEIVGNTITQPRIIAREIELRPGDPLDLGALQLAQDTLELLPLFSDVAIFYEAAPGGQGHDVWVRVQERKTGRVEAGFTYGDREGGIGQFSVREMNLSLKPPFRGAALQGLMTTQWGPRIFRSELGLTNPRVQTSQLSLDGRFFYEDNTFISMDYSQRLVGGQVLAGHPLGLRQWVHTGVAATAYELYDVAESWGDAYEASSNFFLTSLILSWDMDRTDRLLRPTRGFRLRGSARGGSRALGGDTEIIQTYAEGALFFNPFREHVISLRAGARGVDAYGTTARVPDPLRLYLGGEHALRGFGYRTVSPQDEETGRLVGGLSSWWGTIEYLFPLSRRFDLAGYVEAGDVSPEAYRFSGEGPVSNWGLGLLVRADNFPVRFDFAFPLATYEGDRVNRRNEMRLSFSAGYRYH